MKFKAVIFDLFGTLVDNFRKVAYDEVYALMATELDAPYEEFRNAFGYSFTDRCIGRYESIEENIAASCKEIGIQPSNSQIQSAADHRYAFALKTLQADDDVLKTLEALGEVGYRIGLITDCGPDVPKLWNRSPLSGTIETSLFSCLEKIKKPNQEIYQRACERLGLGPDVCVYVGDGSSQEMTGAAEAGFLPILKRIDLSDVYDTRPDIANWQGLSVDRIDELPDLLKELENAG